MNDDKLQTFKQLFAKGVVGKEQALVIQANKLNFPSNDELLRLHLARLGVSELLEYLVWIPIERFSGNLKVLGKGGYSTVYTGIVEWPTDFAFPTIHTIRREGTIVRRKYALKMIDISMAYEVMVATHISYHHTITSVGNDITMPVIGLSPNPDPTSNNYLLVMECANGNVEQEPLNFSNWKEIMAAVIELVRSVMALHKLGVIHGDLHPGNLVTKGRWRQLRIIDVGLSGAINMLHGSDGVYGRLAYLPPEVFNGAAYTQASDIYCLGTLLWQLVTGVPPRGIACSNNCLREEMIPQIPVELEWALRNCWKVDPDRRPSAAVLFESLTRFLVVAPGGEIICFGDETHFMPPLIPLSPKTRSFINVRRQLHFAQSKASSTNTSFVFGEASTTSSEFHTYASLRNLSLLGVAEDNSSVSNVSASNRLSRVSNISASTRRSRVLNISALIRRSLAAALSL